MHSCRLSDIDQASTRIDVEEDMTLPDHCMLFLSNDGAVRRACQALCDATSGKSA
jgi:hypothetical protein